MLKGMKGSRMEKRHQQTVSRYTVWILCHLLMPERGGEPRLSLPSMKYSVNNRAGISCCLGTSVF
jgi:hypothetical protein